MKLAICLLDILRFQVLVVLHVYSFSQLYNTTTEEIIKVAVFPVAFTIFAP